MTEFFQYFATARNLMLVVFLIVAIVTFIVVLLSKHSEAQKWMLIAAIGVIVYFAMNLAPEDDQMIERKMIYISTAWLALGAVLGLMAICEVELPGWVKKSAVILISFMSLAITTINYHNGWDVITLVADPQNPGSLIEQEDNGWMYYLVNIGLLVLLFGFAIYMAVKLSRKKGSKRRALTILALFIGIPAVVWVIAMIAGFSTARSNFILIAGLDAAILVLQIRYNILTTIPVAKEQIVEASDEGIIILDDKDHFLYANATAKSIFAKLDDRNEDHITRFVREHLLCLEQNAKIELADKFYSFYAEDVIEGGHRIGKTLWLKNITTEVNYSNMMLKRSETDLMTELMNRGGGEKRISTLLAEKTPGMFCLLDADHFKSFNDTFGHAVGDAVIRAIADTLRVSLDQELSTIMRLGGDEFAFFVKGILSEEEGQKCIRGVFDNISQVRVEGTDERPICLSFGAVIYNGSRDISFDEIYHAADEGTYASKQHEGNYVSFVELQ